MADLIIITRPLSCQKVPRIKEFELNCKSLGTLHSFGRTSSAALPPALQSLCVFVCVRACVRACMCAYACGYARRGILACCRLIAFDCVPGIIIVSSIHSTVMMMCASYLPRLLAMIPSIPMTLFRIKSLLGSRNSPRSHRNKLMASTTSIETACALCRYDLCSRCMLIPHTCTSSWLYEHACYAYAYVS